MLSLLFLIAMSADPEIDKKAACELVADSDTYRALKLKTLEEAKTKAAGEKASKLRDAKMKRIVESIAELKADPFPLLSFDLFSPPQSIHGVFSPSAVEVVQVVGPMDMLVRGRLDSKRSLIAWMTNAPTAGIVDGQLVHFKGVFIGDGTKMYTTAAGSTNTVRVLRRLDDAIVEYAKKNAAELRKR